MSVSLRRSTHILFGILLILLLGTRGQLGAVGPLTWLPILSLPFGLGQVGILALTPLAFLTLWALMRVRERSRQAWRWGRRGMVLPLAGLTALAGLSLLRVGADERGIAALLALALAWVVYLFVVNEHPDLLIPLSLVVLLQSIVAFGQFWLQDDLGLRALGELDLQVEARGYSIVWALDQRWLRGYGLTPHPNLLGASLAILLLLLLPNVRRLRGWRLAALTGVLAIGGVGLAVTFSRAAWLAFVIGAGVWLLQELFAQRQGRTTTRFASGQWVALLLPAILALTFLVIYRPLVLSRATGFETSYSEAKSINDRERDARIAVTLIRQQPWLGVGIGQFREHARTIAAKAYNVHNAPLLVTAELGVLGGLFWLWLMLAGFRYGWRAPPGLLGIWLALFFIGFFDVTLWLTTSWRAAAIFALVVAQIASAPKLSEQN